MTIDLDADALQRAFRETDVTNKVDDANRMAAAIEVYLTAVWRPIDEGAKGGQQVLLRLKNGGHAVGVWDEWRFRLSGESVSPKVLVEYAPLAALVDLGGEVS